MEQTQVDWKTLPDGLILFLVVLGYVGVLLLFALRAERRNPDPGRNLKRGIGYALSLSVLCTSWTYFGAVGTAVRGGWEFLPNSLGPIIALTLLFPIWRRVARAAQRENVNSVADFISSRYGKSRVLGSLIACVSIIGALPYIALQLTALSKAAAIVVGSSRMPMTAPLIVCTLAGLAILFGARRPTLTQHNRGLTRVVAIESVVKLTALLVVAILTAIVVIRLDVPVVVGGLGKMPEIGPSFIISTILCTATVFSLPRVFHLGFVTLEDMTDLNAGRWIFPLYMAVWAAAIVPIAIAGKTLGIADADTAVLHLPMAYGGPIVTNFAFLGGFSAGAAMVMVEVIALSAMISNELIIPWMTHRQLAIPDDTNIGDFIVNVRRVAIVAILMLSYAYFWAMPADTDLPRLGFTSLAASTQIVPALIGGVLWRRGHARGAFWGIVCGMAVWCWGVVLPQLGGPGLPIRSTLIPNAFDLAVCMSVGINLLIYVAVSLRSRPGLVDTIQSNAFIGDAKVGVGHESRRLDVTVGDLRRLLHRFLGPSDTARGLADFVREHGRPLDDGQPVTPMVARIAERMLAGAIGASSARNVIGLTLAGRGGDAADVNEMLDEAANAIQFSREVVHAALNGIDHGISVVDHDLRLVAWNQRYLELFDCAPDEIYVGRPLREVIELSFNWEAMSARERAVLLEERLGPIKRRESQRFEKSWPNGQTFRIVGRPLAGGEYVTSFSDISEVRAAETAMLTINEELEQRVKERTRELTRANDALADANALAERIMAAQNRFVAAASHDLLQPLHAARLFLGSGMGDLHDADRLRTILERADLSIESADRLLKALLNLSRIEVGGITPEMSPVALDELLFSLRDEFRPLARSKGLELHAVAFPTWISSNQDLLRSVMQNLISNAIRYTDEGRILIGVRRQGEGFRIEVRDTGPGVPEKARDLIFKEFTRLDESQNERGGVGLGLAIAQRICVALGHRLSVQSGQHKGSVFSVTVPRAKSVDPQPTVSTERTALDGLRVLCVEDQPDVREAQTMLLKRWGVQVTEASSAATALALQQPFDVILADFHLGKGMDGASLIARIGARVPARILLTSNVTEDVRKRAESLGISLLRKPVSAGALRAVLMEASRSLGEDVAARLD